MRGSVGGGVLCAAVAVGVLAGCSSAGGGQGGGAQGGGTPSAVAVTSGGTASAGTASAGATSGTTAGAGAASPGGGGAVSAPAAAVPKAGADRIGGAGTPCTLPVAFDVAKDWRPKPVTADTAAELGPFANRGPLTVVCEVDAKPAGMIGFLRVWTGKPGGGAPRQVAEAFIAGDSTVTKSEYRTVRAGSLDAVEVVYTTYSKLLEQSKEEHALAVVTPQGPVVLHLGGLDSDEQREMLPAYELAKQSLALGGQ